MADILAIAGFTYPIVKDLFKLVKKLKKLYKEIRNAKNDLFSVIKRTISVAQTYEFFRDTMKVARRIQELAPMFNRHQQLMGSIDEESKRTIGKLKHITSNFRSLIDDEPVSAVDKWIAQYEWSRESKKTVPSLFQDMDVLERSMRTIGTLVHIQLLSQIYQRDRSDMVLAQFESFKKMLGIEFNKLQQAQRIQKKLLTQQKISPSQHLEAKEFAQKIIQILEKEIPRLKDHQPAESLSMSDSRSPPASQIPNEPSPIATPSPSPPNSYGSQIPVTLQQDENASSHGRHIQRKRRTQSAPSRIPSRSLPSWLFSSDEESEKRRDAELEMHNQNAGQDQGGAYLQMPPFGPPILVSRTSVRRPSPDHSESNSDAFDQQRTMHRGGLHPARRRRNSSKTSKSDDEGEVNANCRTGSVGLPPGRWKGKSRSDQ